MLGELREARLIDAGQEAFRPQHAFLRMADARERLGAGQAFALEVDLGLVPDFQPIVRRVHRVAGRHRCTRRFVALSTV